MGDELSDSVKGKFLLAMPGLPDPNFSQTVTCMCEHNESGALGFIVNKVHPLLTGRELFEDLNIACNAGVDRCHIIGFGDDCALLEELFTHDGSGTLIGTDDYEQSRTATIDDVGGIIELIEPWKQRGCCSNARENYWKPRSGIFACWNATAEL